MNQVKSGVKKFSLYWGSGGEGGPLRNFFFQSEHVSSQIWCQKFFPLLGGGGGTSAKIFFSSLNMYQAKSGVQNFPFTGGSRPRRLGPPPSKARLGPPPFKAGLGPPPIPGWIGTPPPSKAGLGPPLWTDTHLWKHNLPSYVRTRAVIMSKTLKGFFVFRLFRRGFKVNFYVTVKKLWHCV